MSIRLKSILERCIIYLLIFIFSCINLYLYIHKKSIKKKIATENIAIKKLKHEIADNSNKMKSVSEHEKKFQKMKFKIENDIKKYKNIIPTKKRIPELIEVVQKKADNCKVSLTMTNYEPLKKKYIREYSNFNFTVTLKGKYASVKRFLWEIENLDWIIDIETLSINNLPKENDDFGIIIDLKTFFINS